MTANGSAVLVCGDSNGRARRRTGRIAALYRGRIILQKNAARKKAPSRQGTEKRTAAVPQRPRPAHERVID